MKLARFMRFFSLGTVVCEFGCYRGYRSRVGRFWYWFGRAGVPGCGWWRRAPALDLDRYQAHGFASGATAPGLASSGNVKSISRLEHLRFLAAHLELQLPRQNVASQIATERFKLRLLAGEKLLIQQNQPNIGARGQNEGIASSGIGRGTHLVPAKDPTGGRGQFLREKWPQVRIQGNQQLAERGQADRESAGFKIRHATHCDGRPPGQFPHGKMSAQPQHAQSPAGAFIHGLC